MLYAGELKLSVKSPNSTRIIYMVIIIKLSLKKNNEMIVARLHFESMAVRWSIFSHVMHCERYTVNVTHQHSESSHS